MKKILFIVFFIFICTLPSESATIVFDTFTEASDTALENHSPDTGGTWGGAGTCHYVESSTNVLSSDNTGGVGSGTWQYAENGASVGDDEMDITADLSNGATNCCRQIGVCGRIPSGESGLTNSYCGQIGWPNENKEVVLRKTVGGSGSTLGSYTNASFSAEIKLEIRDAAKKVYVDSVERISSADDNLTGNFYAGVIQAADRGTQAGDNFLVESVGVPPAVPLTQIIINITKKIENLFVNNAEAGDKYITGIYRSDVCGDGVTVDPITNLVDDRRPCLAYEHTLKGWVLLYDGGTYMIFKALAEKKELDKILKVKKKTLSTISQEAQDYISLKGEGKIDGK